MGMKTLNGREEATLCIIRFLRDKGLYLLLKVQKGAVAQHFAGTGDRGVADAQDAGQFTGGHIAYGEKIVQDLFRHQGFLCGKRSGLDPLGKGGGKLHVEIPSFFAVSLVRPMIT